MADDYGKAVRVARTNVGQPNSGLVPTERSQIVGREVHQYRSLATGLEGLSQVFSDFTGLAIHSIDEVQQGLRYGREQEIKQENDAQKRQALGDALSGKPMDKALSNDLDYYDAYRSVTAQRDGYQAANDFTNFYLTEWLPSNPTGDLMSARQEWASKNLTGSDDKDYEGQVLASFFEHTDGLIPKHQEFALKYQTAKGMEALGSAIDAQVAAGTMDAGAWSSYIEKARALDPLNSAEAPARVASVLLAAAENHPDQMMAVSNLLSQKGTGMNGKSFAESWPDVYADFQGKAVSAWNQINSVKDMQAFSQLEDRFRNAKSMDDLASLTADVLAFRQQSGALSQTGSLLDQIATQASKLDKQETIFQGIDSFLGGNTGAVDPNDLRSHWTDYLQSRFGTSNIMELDQPVAAHLVQSLGGIVPEEVKTQLSAAILDTRNSQGQALAISLINALTATTGKAYAKSFLSDPAAQLYQNAYALSQTSSEPMESILAHVNDSRSGIKDWTVDWKTITGAKDEPTANTQVLDTINRTLKEQLGQPGWLGGWLFGIGSSSPQVPPQLTQIIMDSARQKALEAAQNGRGWEAGVKDAIEEIASTSEIVPGADGQSSLRLNADRSQLYTGDDGKPAVRPLLSHNAINPTTGQPVDTLQVYSEQLKDLSVKHQWVLPNGSTSGVSLSPVQSPEFASHGVFQVQQDGMPIVYAAGTKITAPVVKRADSPLGPTLVHATEEVTIPSDEAGMEAMFGDIPEGFKFLRVDTPHGVVWQLGYRPNFGNQSGHSLDEQITRFGHENGGGW